jgi:peptide methionine sulfoxide reductase MsrA
VFYDSELEKNKIENYISKLEKSGEYSKPIAVEVVAFDKFYVAEDYHQNYVKLHPTEGYVKGVSIPRYKDAIKKFPELLK